MESQLIIVDHSFVCITILVKVKFIISHGKWRQSEVAGRSDLTSTSFTAGELSVKVHLESGQKHLQITHFSQDFTRVNEEAMMAKADPAGGGYLFSFASAGSLLSGGPEVTLLRGTA